mmetsp:Transcript_23934/g.50785  ORF Transcript_23934/g.50785 Transcript_23934/m.50785 type:complete len:1044 (-) Transcript_23934:478-3609(-)
MRKKIDARVRTLIENGVKLRHRSMFVIVGDAAREQVVNLHYMLSKAVVKARPSVLWCYKKELGFTSHRKKRMKQIKKMVQRGLLDPEKDDKFELFISSTEINYCYYKETHRVLGNTFGMLVLQDFEAVTPNVLARTIETVEGGGVVVLLLKSMSSLKQLYTMSMDAHARFRTEAHQDVQPRFNERFILSLAGCASCLVLDDELNVLPISSHCKAIKPISLESESGDAPSALAISGVTGDSKELKELKASLQDTQPVGSIVSKVRTIDQAKAVLTFVEAAAEKTLRTTVALTAGRGRGKSAALGLSLAAAIAYGYANIFVTSPTPENLRTLFEFVLKGFDALGYKEHTDYVIIESANPDLRKAVVRINVYHAHRQTIQYIEPRDANLLSQAELLVIDEAAAIPMPQVKALLGPYLVFIASTVNGYEGTGRALSLKLIEQLRQRSAPAASVGAHAGAATETSRALREVSLSEPIRYAAGDQIEKWLHNVLCLDASNHVPQLTGLPHPSECELYWVDRDALFSYHSASEGFLQRMMALFVASHYKNTPNDLQLMSDAPAHQLFVLLGPVDVNATKLPDILAVIQVSLEGQVSKASVERAMSRGEAPSGDLIPWTMSQQFQESDFAALSGARVVRIAVHPDTQHMGYGSRAVQQLAHYYQGDLGASDTAKKSKHATPKGHEEAGEGLLGEHLTPRRELPPLLLTLSQRPAERLHWIGASFGLTESLYGFWHKNGFLPVYVRQTKNDITGEHTIIVLRSLDDPDGSLPTVATEGWVDQFAVDFRRRLTSLARLSLRDLPTSLALSLLDPKLQPQPHEMVAPSAEQLNYLMGPYDMKRLQTYARNLADHHLVMDLVPLLAGLCFTGKLVTNLSHVQAAILLGMGLQSKSIDDLEAELGLPASQLLALYNKAMRRLVASLRAVLDDEAGRSLPQVMDAEAATAHMTPINDNLRDELDDGAKESLRALKEQAAQKQQAWLSNESELARYSIKGSDADWQSALGSAKGGITPKEVSVKGEKRDYTPASKEKKGKKHGKATSDSGKRKRSDKA